MARHYTTKDFFRQIPNVMLARYFQGRGLLGDLGFSAMKETQPDELFAAWLQLPDAQRNEMDAEFRDIFELSCEKGLRVDSVSGAASDSATKLLRSNCRMFKIKNKKSLIIRN